MCTALRVSLPHNEAPRRSCQTERGTSNFVISGAGENSFNPSASQPGSSDAPRIIRTHWLRLEHVEGAYHA